MTVRSGTRTLLGGHTPRQFLSRYWQKQCLFVPDALADFGGLLEPSALVRLAQSRDVQARVVLRTRGKWYVQEGPFGRSYFSRLPARGWTLLVHDVDHHLPSARALLSRFAFVPYSRLDDLMVSYAAPGGGVGPHFDSYDVFLLQGLGTRRWRIGRQADHELIDGAPLKLLRRFRPENEWAARAGDLLYLPPEWAHDGVALTPCMTYSIGFRAPGWNELAIHFLRFLEDRVQDDGLYADPRLKPALRPARLGDDMVREVARRLQGLRWRQRDVTSFLGAYLTEPKPHVFFTKPRVPLQAEVFARRAAKSGVVLDLKSEMLYRDDLFFINGETVRVAGSSRSVLVQLADKRRLEAVDVNRRGLVPLLHDWHSAGYLALGADAEAVGFSAALLSRHTGATQSRRRLG